MPGTPAEMATCETHWPVIARAYRDDGRRPLLLSQVLQPMGPEARQVAQASGLHDIIFGMDFGTRALGHLVRWSGRLSDGSGPVEAVAALADPPRLAGERDGLDFLARHGVPVVPGEVVQDAGSALSAARLFASPVVLKIASPDIAHKTEAGGVKLGIAPQDAGRAHD